MFNYLPQDRKTASKFEKSQLFQDSMDLILASKTIVTHMMLHLLTRLNLVKNANFP